MTTDPFTTADDQWDESPHHLADHCEHAGVGKACRRCRRKFDAAAQWARAHLAAQEPTDAEVEAAEVEWEHHQPYKRFRMWWCRCGAPEKWGSLEAHRQHALRHILRATRRDEEKQ